MNDGGNGRRRIFEVGDYSKYGGQRAGGAVKLWRVIVHYIYYGFHCSQRVFAGIDGSYLVSMKFTRVRSGLMVLLMSEVDGLLEEVSARRRGGTVV